MFLRSCDKINFLRRERSGPDGREVHLALWDALVIEGGRSMDRHKERATDVRNNGGVEREKKVNKTTTEENTQLAAEGGFSLTSAHFPLDGKVTGVAAVGCCAGL